MPLNEKWDSFHIPVFFLLDARNIALGITTPYAWDRWTAAITLLDTRRLFCKVRMHSSDCCYNWANSNARTCWRVTVACCTGDQYISVRIVTACYAALSAGGSVPDDNRNINVSNNYWIFACMHINSINPQPGPVWNEWGNFVWILPYFYYYWFLCICIR